jgi:hypothetical protein
MASVVSVRSSSSGTTQSNASLKIVGIVLAIVSGLLIGSSFVFKKKGLLRAQAGGPAGEGVAYLKSVCRPQESQILALSNSVSRSPQALWWLGMISSSSSVVWLNHSCDTPIGKQ